MRGCRILLLQTNPENGRVNIYGKILKKKSIKKKILVIHWMTLVYMSRLTMVYKLGRNVVIYFIGHKPALLFVKYGDIEETRHIVKKSDGGWEKVKLQGCFSRLIVLVGRVFANDPGDRGSVPGRVIPKTLKMVIDTSLLNAQHYKVRIKGKVEQSREKSCTLSYTSV